MKFAHVLSFALDHPWAMTAPMRAIVADLLVRRLAGSGADDVEITAAVASRRDLPKPVRGGNVAVIPVYGVIAPRMNLMSEMSGGTTFEGLTASLNAAMADDSIKTIVFDVDSPGGDVAGATEFARAVMKARVTKPIVAQAQYLMASAAYWPMSCATEIVASPSALVGSIGVYAMHDDVSEALAKLGIKREAFIAGKFKAEGVDGGPLSEEARVHIKALIDSTYGTFVDDIAKGRGVKASAVRGGYGEGRCVSAEQAKELGMIDRIGTMDETLARVMSAPPRPGSRAEATRQEPHLAAARQEPGDAHFSAAFEGELLALEI